MWLPSATVEDPAIEVIPGVSKDWSTRACWAMAVLSMSVPETTKDVPERMDALLAEVKELVVPVAMKHPVHVLSRFVNPAAMPLFRESRTMLPLPAPIKFWFPPNVAAEVTSIMLL